MVLNFDPVVLSIGLFAVRWLGLLALCGLAVAVWLGWRALERRGLGHAAALDGLAWALPAGVLCGRVVHVLSWWDYYFMHADELWQLHVDGLSLWGALLGGGALAFARLGTRADRVRRRLTLDAVVPYVALGIAIGGLGAFLDGHGQGVPADLPWATRYSHPLAATPDFGVLRHPAQLYDALIALGLYGLLVGLPAARSAGDHLRGAKALLAALPPGGRVALFLVVYGASRVVLAGVRLEPVFLFGWQLEQMLALAGVALGLIYVLRPVSERAHSSRGASPGPTQAKEDSLAA